MATEGVNTYHIVPLLEAQCGFLSKDQSTFKKEVFLNGKTETQHIGPLDSAKWAKEFGFFKRADLSSASVLSNYDLDDSSTTSGALYTARLKPATRGRLKELAISRDSKGVVNNVKVTLSDEQYLFKTGKRLEMTFDQGIVQSYSITGFQKMITKDSVTYRVKAHRVQ